MGPWWRLVSTATGGPDQGRDPDAETVCRWFPWKTRQAAAEDPGAPGTLRGRGRLKGTMQRDSKDPRG